MGHLNTLSDKSMIQDSPKNENDVVLRAFGQEAHILISSDQTGNAFCLIRFFAWPENTNPPHMHSNEDETFIIEAGQIEVDRGGEIIRGKPGDVIYLPKKIRHAPRILGTEPLQTIVLCVPGGFDRFFAECAEEWKKPAPDLREIAGIAARYGIQFF
jgi:mannose-6-phosphate isomerase-like protein (cupin superfamily)